MLRFFSVLAVAIALGRAQDAGQPSAEELARIASLHRSVYEQQSLPSTPVPAAARELGLRYLQGQGVERDRLQGCALLETSWRESLTAPHEDAAGVAESERLKKEHCSGLSEADGEEVWQLAECGIFGVAPRVIQLEPGSWVDVSPRELILDTPVGRKTDSLNSFVGCGNQVALLRHVRVDPPIGLNLPPRHLIELAEWMSAPSTNGSHRALRWFLLDLRSMVNVVAIEVLEQGSGSAWPQPPLPAGLQRGTTFTMLSSGAVRWEIPGKPVYRGEFSK